MAAVACLSFCVFELVPGGARDRALGSPSCFPMGVYPVVCAQANQVFSYGDLVPSGNQTWTSRLLACLSTVGGVSSGSHAFALPSHDSCNKNRCLRPTVRRQRVYVCQYSEKGFVVLLPIHFKGTSPINQRRDLSICIRGLARIVSPEHVGHDFRHNITLASFGDLGSQLIHIRERQGKWSATLSLPLIP
jgi:hypothetical protein